MNQSNNAEAARKEFSERLLHALSKKGIRRHGSARRLADLCGVTPKAATKWINAEAIPNHERLVAIANFLDVSSSWLEYGEGQEAEESHGSHSIPQLNKADITSYLDGAAPEMAPAPDFIGLISDHLSCSGRAFCYTEDLGSIPARITPGKTLVLVDPEKKPAPGDACLIHLESGAMIVGIYSKTPSGTVISFQNAQPGWEPIKVSDDSIIGKVMATYDPNSSINI